MTEPRPWSTINYFGIPFLILSFGVLVVFFFSFEFFHSHWVGGLAISAFPFDSRRLLLFRQALFLSQLDSALTFGLVLALFPATPSSLVHFLSPWRRFAFPSGIRKAGRPSKAGRRRRKAHRYDLIGLELCSIGFVHA